MKTRRREKIKTRIEGKWAALLLIFFASFTLATPSNAQCKFVNKTMINGEEISYDLYFHWGLIWKQAGTATYKVAPTTYEGLQAHEMSLLLSTNKSADAFFKMRDTLQAVVTHDLVPLYYKKAAEEGKRYTIDEAQYIYSEGKTIVKQKRTWKDGSSENFEDKESECVYDMLSILAKTRAMDLNDYKKGDRLYLPLATGKKVENVVLEFRGSENVKTENKTVFKCIVFTLITKDKKNKEKDLVTFYVSDDENLLPIKLDLNLNFGSAQVILNNIKGQRYPLKAIVKKK